MNGFDPARRDEASPVEERSAEITVRFYRGRGTRCPWCWQGVDRHSAIALTLCEQRFAEQMRSRSQGQVRVADLVGRKE